MRSSPALGGNNQKPSEGAEQGEGGSDMSDTTIGCVSTPALSCSLAPAPRLNTRQLCCVALCRETELKKF
jgi:hypothetical protein